MVDPRDEYTTRQARWDGAIARGERTHNHFANLRLADAGAAIVVGWAAFAHVIDWWWLAGPATVFLILAIVHDRVLKGIERSRRARGLYERGLARMDGTWPGSGPDGARFGEGQAVAGDLDLFGQASLFQLLSTARTEIGEETLANWLLQGADIGEVRERQAAVGELRDLIDFREALAVTAADVAVARTGRLAAWARVPAGGFPRVARVVFVCGAVGSAVAILAALIGWLPFSLLMAWGLVPGGLAAIWVRRTLAALAGVDKASDDLALLRVLLERIEAQRFQSPRLVALHGVLAGSGQPASRAIARLERLVATLDSCRNQMFLPIAILFMVPSQLAVAIDRWRSVHGAAVAGWLGAVGECEALASLATYAFEHPADAFPTLDDATPLFDAADLGHPLLVESVAVRNDVHLGGAGPHVLMVSGSNMSGKSTLLRTVGVNVVLALAGAPVRAGRMRLSRLALGTSLRVEDSLQEGHSRFYAEILRIRAVVDLARGPVPALFLLDEILGGTNSHDRRIGAEAIVRGLAQAGAIGLVTTHDLALTELVPALGVPAANVHFEDRLENGRMIFDYRMRPGVVEHSNALALMRAVGLDV